MWDHVMPTQDWIHLHIPALVLENAASYGNGLIATTPGLDHQSLR